MTLNASPRRQSSATFLAAPLLAALLLAVAAADAPAIGPAARAGRAGVAPSAATGGGGAIELTLRLPLGEYRAAAGAESLLAIAQPDTIEPTAHASLWSRARRTIEVAVALVRIAIKLAQSGFARLPLI